MSCVDYDVYVETVTLVSVFFLMIRRPPRSTLDRSSAASDVYKRQPISIELKDFGSMKHTSLPQVRCKL